MKAIQLEGVAKRFGETRSLDGLTLAVERGTLFGFLGPNGAGKTTTIRAMLGMVLPDQGSVRVLGHDPGSSGGVIRRQVGVLLESDGLYEGLSAEENLEYHARLHGMPDAVRRERITELLAGFGLVARRRESVRRWSRGMRQKLAIARALLHRPQLVLLDEPFAGLDPAAAVELRETLASMVAREGTTLFLTSHDLSHVEKICSAVAVIKAGRIIATGTPSSLLQSARDVEVEVRGAGLSGELLDDMTREGLLVSHSIEGTVARLVCTLQVRPRLVTELVRRGVAVEEARTRTASLEEAFLELVGTTEAGT